MLDSKQSVNVDFYLDFSISDTVKSLLQKCLTFQVNLLLPEDTSEGATRLINAEEQNRYSGAKLVFWFAGAVAISLLLGQLN